MLGLWICFTFYRLTEGQEIKVILEAEMFTFQKLMRKIHFKITQKLIVLLN